MAKSVRFACLFAAAATMLLAADAQIITSITPTVGGVKGGTRVTILGSSFDSRGRSNDVYIGSDTQGVFCDPIPNECHDARIVCITPAFTGRGRFPLKVTSFGNVATCSFNNGDCGFSYMYDYTPTITGIQPEFFTEPASLTVTGTNFDRGDVTVGSFDFTTHLGDEERCDLGANSVSSTGFVCSVENGVFPGMNPLSVQLGTRGYATGNLAVMIVPSITGISQSTGSTEGGQRVTITGNFFSRTLTENIITIHGAECAPVVATPSMIVCITGKHAPTSTAARTYTAGTQLDYWGENTMSGQTIMTVQQTLRYLSPDIERNVSGFGGVLGAADYCLTRATALFAPNVTGNYTFNIAGDDYGELWLGADENPVPYVKTVAPDDINFNARRIATLSSYASSFTSTPEQQSDPVYLVAGQKYWMRLFAYNGQGAHSASVRVQDPNGAVYVNPTNVYLPQTWQSPVVVTSRGIRSVQTDACATWGSCDFNYATSGAVVSSVTASVDAGSAITITGTGFPTVTTLVSVATGRYSCAVTSASATQIVCTTNASAAAGTVPVIVTIVGAGNAVSDAKVTINFAIVSANNANGYVSIVGNGIAVSTDRISVTVGGFACTNVVVVGNTIQCAPNSAVTSGTVTANVAIKDATTTVASRAFTFKQTLIRPGTTTATSAPLLLTPTIPAGSYSTIEFVVYTWSINNADDVSVTLGTRPCTVITAIGSSVVCAAPSVDDVKAYNVSATFSGETIIVGAVSVVEAVSSIGQSRISKTGGNIVEINYKALRVPTSVGVTYRGVPCKEVSYSLNNYIRCLIDDASLTNSVALPTLLSVSSTTANYASLLTMSPSVAVVTGGFKIPKGGYLFTRRTFDHAIAITATVTTLTSGSSCVKISGLSPDPSASYGGFTAYSNGNANAYHVANQGYAPVSDIYAADSVPPSAGTSQTWRLEIHSGGARFFVDGLLVRVMNRGWVGAGYVGFPVQCQDIRVEDIKVEDLRPATLALTVDDRTVTMFDEPVLVETISMDVRTATAVVTPGATLTITLGPKGLSRFDVFAFPANTSDYQLTSSNGIKICDYVGYSSNTDGTIYTATCTVGDIAAGSYTLRVVTDNGGFATAKLPLTVFPAVSSVTSTGSYFGAIVQVSGSGFTNSLADTVVTIGGVSCPVVHSTLYFVSCRVPAASGGAVGPFTVAISHKSQPLTCVSCTFTYLAAASSPAVTSVTLSPGIDRAARDVYVIQGAKLQAGSATVGGKVCESYYNTATASYCGFDNYSPAPGTYSFVYLTSVGYASVPSNLTWTVTAATGYASPAVTAAAGSTDITINAASITPSKGMTSVASFDFSTGSLENAQWTVSQGKAVSYTCGSAYSEFGGYQNFNGTTVLTRSLTGLSAHTFISIAVRISVHSNGNEAFVVDVDGTKYRLESDTYQCHDQYNLGSICAGISRTDCLVDTTIAVPHSGATATIKLSYDSYYSSTDRSWGLVSYDIGVGALAYTATVAGNNCPVLKATPHAIVCTAPSGSGTVAVSIMDGASALPCVSTSMCQVTYSTAANLGVSALVYTTLPTASTGTSLNWGFVSAASVTNGVKSSITRASGSGWSSSATTLQRFRKEDMFAGVAFSFSGSLMFGITYEERRETTYADIDFAFYSNGNAVTLYRRGVWTGDVFAITTESSAFIRVLENDAVVFEVSGKSVQVGRITSWPIRLSAALNGAGSKLWNIEPLFLAGAPAASTKTSVAILATNMPNPATVTLDGSACDRVVGGQDIVVCDIDTTAAVAGGAHTISVVSANGATTANKNLQPVVTSLSAASGSVSGNHVITIFGGGFTGTVAASIGASACSVLSFAFDRIVCVVPAGTGTQAVTVTVNGAATACASFNGADANTNGISYVCANYTYTTAATTTTSASASGSFVSLVGTGFPSTTAGAVMYLGTYACPVTAVTSTQATCDASQIPAGTLSVIASFPTTGGAGAAQSVTLALTAGATPSQVGSLGNARITITGTGFGASGALTVQASGSDACASITDRTATSFVCTTKPMSFTTLTVTSPAGGANTVAVTTDKTPTITSVAPTTVRSGAVITLTGTNFVAGNTIAVGAAACTVLTTSATSIACRVEAGLARGSVGVLVTAGPLGASAAVSVTGALAVLGTSPNTAAPNTTVTVVGSAFVGSETYLVRLGDYECTNVAFVDSGKITCTSPATTDFVGSILDVSVAVIAATSTTGSVTYTHVAVVTPTLTGVSPSTGSRAGGLEVTVVGTGFDVDPQQNRVSIGGAACSISAATTTQLLCVIDPITTGTDGNRDVVVTSRGIPASSTLAFNAVMNITAISPAGGAVSVEGGVVLTVTGNGFAPAAKDSFSLTVGAISCPIIAMTTTSVTCKLGSSPRPYIEDPELTSTYSMHPDADAVIRLVINGTTAAIDDSTLIVSYRATATPTITAVSAPSTVMSGSLITITGTGFAASGNVVELTPVALGTNYSTCAVSTETTTQIVCTANLTTFGSHLVRVNVPNKGFAYTARSCPSGYLSCDGVCLTDSDCSYSYWGIFGSCDAIFKVMRHDTYCDSNSGSDRVNLPMLLDNGKAINANCPLYSCEGKDCNSTLSIGGSSSVVSTCGKDPNGFLVTAKAHVASVAGSAVSGSKGGNRLTLTGTNLPIDSVIRFYSDSVLVSACTPVVSTGSSLVCEMTSQSQDVSGLTMKVTVAGVEAVCDACTGFAYSAAATPSVTAYSPLTSSKLATVVAGASLTITGTGFSNDNAMNNVFFGGVRCVTTASTTTSIVCTAPDLAVGTYAISVRVDGKGLASDTTGVSGSVRTTVTALSSVVSSLNGGARITVTGSALAGAVRFYVSNCADFTPVSQSSTQFVFDTPACASGAKQVRVQVVAGTDSVCTGCTVTYGTSSTPSASITAGSGNSITATIPSAPTNAGDISVTIGVGTCTMTGSYSAGIYTCDLPSSHPAGTYAVVVTIAGLGKATIATPFTKTYAGGITAINPTTGSLGGGQTVTISGTGLPTAVSQVTNLTVAGVRCAVATATSTSLTCVTSAPAGEVSGTVSMSIGTTVLSGPSFAFNAASTPVVTSVYPTRGSTAGGTRITVTGQLLNPSVTIKIDGVVCTQTADQISGSTPTAYLCTTGNHGTSLETSQVRAFDATYGNSVTYGQYQYIDLWSRWTTWGNNAPPAAGDSVVISEGQTVMLDVSPPQLYLIIVMGHLIFDPSVDLTLECTYIMVNYGRLTIGTEDAPYTKNATIRLYGTRLTPEIPVHGAKVIALRHGTLDMHGIPRTPTWTKVAASASANSRTLQVRGPVDWKAGETIVVTSTNYEMEQAEERTIVSVTNGASSVATLELSEPLQYFHNGAQECFDNNKVCIEEIAEVMLLSRNIIIEGDARSQELGFGGTMFLMPMGQDSNAYARLSYVEFRDVGQQYIVGRYPVHFHVTGSANNSYVNGTSVHRSLNRAFSIHGISNNTYVNNVAYDIQGHAFFIEDGSEKYNVIENNLVALVHTSTSNLNTDITPACFWCVSTLNKMHGNHAAGSSAYGFWISPFHPHSTGPTYSPSICPSTHKMWHFENNVAHSNKKYGLNVFQYWWPKKTECDFNGADEQATIRNHFSFKNKIHGVSVAHSEVGQVGSVIFDNLVSSSNGQKHEDASAFWIERLNAPNMTIGVQNSYLIALTSNNPEVTPNTRRGINLPLSDNFFSSNISFINYVDNNFGYEPQRWAERMSFCFPWGWEATSRKLNWVNSPNRIRFRFDHHGLLHDEDGTLSGSADTQTLVKTALMDPAFCTETSIASPKKAIICNAGHKMRRHGVDTVSNIWADQLFTIADRTELVPEIKHQYSMIIPMNRELTIDFNHAENPNTWAWTISPRFAQPNERLLINTLYKETRYSVNATIDGTITAMKSTRPTLADNVSSYYYADQVLTALIARPNKAVGALAATCPAAGCPIEPPSPAALGGPCKPWNLASSWATGKVPGSTSTDLQDVSISYTDSICLNEPRDYYVQNLLLEGKLEVNNSFCANSNSKIRLIVTKKFHIRGGVLQIGNSSAEAFTACGFELIIAQTDFTNMDSNTLRPWNARTLIMESGVIELKGAAKTRHATLAATAAAGSTTLVLDRAVNWVVGDLIAIAMTRRERIFTRSNERTEESEDNEIAAISGTTITLKNPLTYAHDGAAPQTFNGASYSVGADVICLSRNIKFGGGSQKGDVLPYGQGWNFAVGCTSGIYAGCAAGETTEVGWPMGTLKTGTVHIENVAFEDIGQEGAEHGSLELDGLFTDRTTASAKGSYIRGCAFNRARNDAISIRSSTDRMEVSNNVIYNVGGDGVRVGGVNNIIDGNVVIRHEYLRPSCDFNYKFNDFINMDCIGGAFRITSGNEVRNNIASSGEGAGFLTEGEACGTSLNWYNNTAHHNRDGLLIRDYIGETDRWKWPDVKLPCRQAGGVIAHSNSDHGVVGFYVASQQMTVTDITAVSNHVGVAVLMYEETIDVGENQIELLIQNSAIGGYWASETCNPDHTYPARHSMVSSEHIIDKLVIAKTPAGHIGIMETVFTHFRSSDIKKTKGEHKFMWIEPDSYANVKGRARIDNVFFDNFRGTNPCGHKEIAFSQNFVSNDTFHHHVFSNIHWGSSIGDGGEFFAWDTYGDIKNRFHDEGTKLTWLNFDDEKFGAYWPDAPNKVWLADSDGSFTKTNTLSHVLTSRTLTRLGTFDRLSWSGSELNVVDAAGDLRTECTYETKWNAHKCTDVKYISVSMESYADDALTRRAPPVVMCKGDGMINEAGRPLCQGGEIDFVSGPYMKGKVQRATLDRLPRFRFNVEAGHNYTLYFRGQPPTWLKFWLTNYEYTGMSPADIGVVLHLRYFGLNAKSRAAVYANGVRQHSNVGIGSPYQWGYTYPMPTDAVGTHYHDKAINNGVERNIMIFTLRPISTLELKQEPIVFINMDVSMNEDDFFNQKNTFVAAMANVLGIDASRIRFAKIVAGTSSSARRLTASTTSIGLEIEAVSSVMAAGASLPVNSLTTDLAAVNDKAKTIASSVGSFTVSGVSSAVEEVSNSPKDIVVSNDFDYIVVNITRTDGGLYDNSEITDAIFAYSNNVIRGELGYRGLTEDEVASTNVAPYWADNKTRAVWGYFITDADRMSNRFSARLFDHIKNGDTILPSYYIITDVKYQRQVYYSAKSADDLQTVFIVIIVIGVALIVGAAVTTAAVVIYRRNKAQKLQVYQKEAATNDKTEMDEI